MSKIKYLSGAEIAERWGFHRSSIIRVMGRFGYSGLKFGANKQAGRRYSEQDVLMVEKLTRLGRLS